MHVITQGHHVIIRLHYNDAEAFCDILVRSQRPQSVQRPQRACLEDLLINTNIDSIHTTLIHTDYISFKKTIKQAKIP